MKRLDSAAVEASTVHIHHPNREKAQSKATKAGVVLLLLVSAALIAIVLVGGWSKMAGAELVAAAYVIIYLIVAYFVAARWSRGVLPLTAGLSIIFISMAAVAAPAWFARDKDGFNNPALPPELLGLLTLVIIAVQLLLIVFSMRGFTQEWNVEVEVSGDEGGDGHGDYGEGDHGGYHESAETNERGASGPAVEHGAQGGEEESAGGQGTEPSGPQSPR